LCFFVAVATFTARRKRSHVAIFTATVAVNIATWLCLRRYTSYLWCHLSNVK